ncbi:MAG TPA: hypothetical protein VJ793_23470 [Anaerolineae bacterium]|nr:hypothetical protein [Anaerolineae bacterium]
MTPILEGITPHISALLVIAAVIAITLIALRVKHDGWHVTFLESADQRWKRHEDYRMGQWAKRDQQRQRFHAAMIGRTHNAADDRCAARNRQANTPRPPARRDTMRTSIAVAATGSAVTPAPDTKPAGDDIPPDIANPFMTVGDWVMYLTTE